jgi:hypothetical protein
MNRSEDEFWHSSFANVIKMIDMYTDELQMQAAAMKKEFYQSKYFETPEKVRKIKSMKEIEGW